MTSLRLANTYHRFGGAYLPYFQNSSSPRILKLEEQTLRNVGNCLQVHSQNTCIFISTAVRTLNLTCSGPFIILLGVNIGLLFISLTHRTPLTPRKYSWHSLLLEAESTPGAKCGRKDYVNEKLQSPYRESNPRPSGL